MKCMNCQAENPDNALFCGSCGSKLGEQATVTPNQSEQATEATETYSLPDPTISQPVQPTAPQPTAPQPVKPTAPQPTAPQPVQPTAPQQAAPQPVQSTAPQTTAPQPVQPTAPTGAVPVKPKKKSKLPVVLVVILLIAAIGTAGYVFGKDAVMSLFKSPEERLVDGFFNAIDARSGEYYTIIELNELEVNTGDAESDAMMQDLLSDLKIETMIRFDEKARQLEGDMNLRLMGTSLVSVDYYLTDEYLILDVPLLYGEPMYWELHSLVASMRESSADGTLESQLGMLDGLGGLGMGGIDLNGGTTVIDEGVYIDFDALSDSMDNYKDMADRDIYSSYESIDWTPYKEVMIPYYVEHTQSMEDGDYEMNADSDITYKGTRYDVELDYEAYGDMIVDMAAVLAEDENIKAFLEEVVTTLFDRIIENKDYTMYALLSESSMEEVTSWDKAFEEDLEDLRYDALDSIGDAFDDMDMSIEEARDEMKNSSDVDVDEIMDKLDVSMTLDLDDAGNIRSQIVEIEGSLGEGGQMDLMDPSADMIQFIRLTLINEFNLLNEQVEFSGIDKDDAVDIGAMSDEERLMFEMEIQNNVLESLMNNPAFSEIMNSGFDF